MAPTLAQLPYPHPGWKVNRCHLTTARCTNATTIAVHKIYSRDVEFPRPVAQAAVKAAALACPALGPSVAAIINIVFRAKRVPYPGVWLARASPFYSSTIFLLPWFPSVLYNMILMDHHHSTDADDDSVEQMSSSEISQRRFEDSAIESRTVAFPSDTRNSLKSTYPSNDLPGMDPSHHVRVPWCGLLALLALIFCIPALFYCLNSALPCYS